MGLAFVIGVFFAFPQAAPPAAGEGEVLFREDFQGLVRWKPVRFPKIKEHTSYTIETENGSSYLRAESSGSASGLVFTERFSVFDYPMVRWRWKVSNVYEKGDARARSGDDYPARVYVIFQYDPEKADFFERLTYSLAKAVYGEYPPRSSLNYIWANRRYDETVIPNAYTGKSRMIVLEAGGEKAGQWLEEEVDVLRDYRRAFGEDPPATASIAFMNDSDNTGEASVSWLDYIEVFRYPPSGGD